MSADSKAARFKEAADHDARVEAWEREARRLQDPYMRHCITEEDLQQALALMRARPTTAGGELVAEAKALMACDDIGFGERLMEFVKRLAKCEPRPAAEQAAVQVPEKLVAWAKTQVEDGPELGFNKSDIDAARFILRIHDGASEPAEPWSCDTCEDSGAIEVVGTTGEFADRNQEPCPDCEPAEPSEAKPETIDLMAAVKQSCAEAEAKGKCRHGVWMATCKTCCEDEAKPAASSRLVEALCGFSQYVTRHVSEGHEFIKAPRASWEDLLVYLTAEKERGPTIDLGEATANANSIIEEHVAHIRDLQRQLDAAKDGEAWQRKWWPEHLAKALGLAEDVMGRTPSMVAAHVSKLRERAEKAEAERGDYIDGVHAMLLAAGASEDVDELERQLRASGTKPSHFIAAQMKKAEASGNDKLRELRAKMREGLASSGRWISVDRWIQEIDRLLTEPAGKPAWVDRDDACKTCGDYGVVEGADGRGCIECNPAKREAGKPAECKHGMRMGFCSVSPFCDGAEPADTERGEDGPLREWLEQHVGCGIYSDDYDKVIAILVRRELARGGAK